MSESSGLTRTVVNPRYALLTPDVFVPSVVQGWKESEVVVNISPAMSGPRFTLLQIALSREGTGEGNTGANEYFIFVTEGTGSILLANKRHRLESGSYIFLPPNTDMQMKSGGVMKVAIFQKRYVPLKSVVAPVAFVSHEREVRGVGVADNDGVHSQRLLPAEKSFDMDASLVTFKPEHRMSRVEVKVAEQGILMLSGQGNWRLGQDVHAAKQGDALWIGSFCPHHFAAKGKSPASFLRYSDANRDPM